MYSTHLGVVCYLGGAVALQLQGLVDPIQAHSPQDGLLVGAVWEIIWRGGQRRAAAAGLCGC